MSLFARLLHWLRGPRGEAALPPTPVSHVEEPGYPLASLRSEYVLRVPQPLLARMLADLRRPHSFAYERIGFLLGREAQGAEQRIVLAGSYEPVGEDEYVDDPKVGARIGRAVIRRMMARALAGDSILHVHLHAHEGLPSFSAVDVENLRELVPSFSAVRPDGLHGALLLSEDCGMASLWKYGSTEPARVSVTIVGYPLRRWEEGP